MYTLQFSKDGRTFYPGYFRIYYSDEGIAKYSPYHMTLQDLCQAFENVWATIDASDYDVADMNCKHYAKDLYNYIYNNY